MSNQTQQKNNEFHFEVPFDVLPLPSKGLLYPGKSDSIKVEYMTASDENILTSPNLIKSGKVLDILIERKVKESPVPVDDMLVGDRNAIMIWLRATGYGEMYPVKMTDPMTAEEFDYEIDLNDLKSKPIGVQPDENNEFSFDMPKSKSKIKFKMLTVKDERDIVQQNEKRNKLTKSKINNILTSRLEKQIVEINGNRDPNYISKYIQVIPAYDSLKFREYLDKIEPGIDMTVDVEAPSGEPFRGTVPLGLNFFWPNARV
jgi:hypothetical protein